MEYDHSVIAMQAICMAADDCANRIMEATSEFDRPSFLFKPTLTIDGTSWCALYGDDIQTGVCGFGDSPAGAYEDFDRAWRTTLKKAAERTGEKDEQKTT